MTTVKENSMDSCQDPVSFIIDSFLERPEDWDFGSFESSFDADYATHKKSGFKLKLYQYNSRSETPPVICSPDWAYKYKFTKEEKRLLMAAIQPVREIAIAKAKKKIANQIVRYLDPPEKPVSAPNRCGSVPWSVIAFVGILITGIFTFLVLT